MFSLRKRLSAVKPPASFVSELPPVLHNSEDEDIPPGEKGAIEPREGFGYAGHENMVNSFSSISDASQSSEETDEEDAVPPAVDVEDTKVPIGEELNIERADSPEVLGDEAHAENLSRPAIRPRRQTTRSSSSIRTRREPSSSSSSWLGLNMSIIIALISPIGNLLTGGDHVKNVLLLLLLIYYLHQLVEVPWTLYRMSIPKQSFDSTDARDEEGKRPAKHVVHDELRALEIFYLFLTVLSPFIGAVLLRYVATTISGDKATLSWFSTTLFVFATGIRPWSHLVERLKDRSRALNTILEDMEDVGEEMQDGQRQSSEQADEQSVIVSGKISELRHRLDRVDARIADLNRDHVNEWDDLADAIDSVDEAVKKLRADEIRKELAREARLDALEAYVLGLQYANRAAPSEPSPLLAYLRGQQLRALFWDIIALPWSITSLLWAAAKRIARDVQRLLSGNGKPSSQVLPPKATTQAKVKFAVHAHTHGHGRLGSGNGVRAPTLEPILEEDMPRSDEDQTLVGEPVVTTMVKPIHRQSQDPLDPFAHAVAQAILFIFSPAVLLAKFCIMIVGFPVRVLRVLFV